jgi:hypothetical protein
MKTLGPDLGLWTLGPWTVFIFSKNNAGIDATSGRNHAPPDLSGIAEAAASYRAFDPKRTAS